MSFRSPLGWERLGDIRGRAAWVVLGCLVCQLGLGFGYVFGPLAEDMLGEFSWTRAEFSGARLPQLLATSLTSPLIGWMVFRFGARGVLAGATVLLGLAFAGVSQIQNLEQYYALIVLIGLAVTGLGDITVGTAVSQWVVRRRGLALGLVYAGSNLGGWLLTRVASAVAVETSWRTALLWIGLGGLAVILPFAVWAVRAPRPGEGADSREEGPTETGEASRAAGLELTAAVRTRSFWILAFSLFVFFFYFLAMIDHFVLFLRGGGLSREEATGYYSTAIGLGIASKLGYGWIADRVSRRATLTLDFGVLTASSAVLLTLPDPAWIWLFIVTYSLSTAGRDVVYPLVIQYCFGERSMPKIYGALMLGLVAGGGLGPLFAGRVFDLTGSYQPAFATFAALNAVAFLACFFVRPESTV